MCRCGSQVVRNILNPNFGEVAVQLFVVATVTECDCSVIMVADPWYRTANFAPFQNYNFAGSKRNNYAHLIWKMVYIRMLFSHVRHKVYFRRYGRQTRVMIFHSLLIFRLKNRTSPFALTKHVNAVSLKLH